MYKIHRVRWIYLETMLLFLYRIFPISLNVSTLTLVLLKFLSTVPHINLYIIYKYTKMQNLYIKQKITHLHLYVQISITFVK